MSATLKYAPTPEQFAKAWTASFAAAVRDAAGKDGRLSISEATKIAGRSDALRMWGDNALNYLASKDQKSVSVEVLIESGYRYAYANAVKATGGKGVMSLVEARAMNKDLQDDFAYLRGKLEASAPVAPSFKATDKKIQAAFKSIEDVFDPISDGQHFFANFLTGVSSIADVKQMYVQRIEERESLDWIEVSTDMGKDAIKSFTRDLQDLVEHTYEGEEAKALQKVIKAVESGMGDANIAHAYVLTLEATGSQYGRNISALISQGKDGTWYAVESEYAA